MKENPLLKVQTFGQSIWMDYLSRQVIASKELARLVKEDGLRGVTSNPAIFDKAIGGGNDYDDVIHTLFRKGKSIEDIYQAITVDDIQRAAPKGNRPKICKAGWPSPAPGKPIRSTRKFFMGSGFDLWLKKGPRCSASCGPVPAPRIPLTPI